MGMQFTSVTMDSKLLQLPWHLPLDQWPDDILVPLPRGISRHVVRFVQLDEQVYAVKEIIDHIARREYMTLRHLQQKEQPCVQPLAVVSNRTDEDGRELLSALVTKHLSFSLPYRALFEQNMRPQTINRLIDSLAVLIVRLHLNGFYWGDVSLSNTLFRRDAGAFAAYLVDAETGELYPELTDGQRTYDIDLARTNIIGEMMDLQSGAFLDSAIDVIELGDRLHERYHELWNDLTAEETFTADEGWRVESRVRRLNKLGFDIDEMSITTDSSGTVVKIQPKVVDAGHFHRQVMRLTGLDVEEQQAQRMINDMIAYQTFRCKKDLPLELVAHSWLHDVFEPVVAMVPKNLEHKLAPAQLFHEILEHRWYMSERRGKDVGTKEAVSDYVKKELSRRPDEEIVVG